jgi:hypothetical protein
MSERVVPTDDTDQELLTHNEKLPRMTDDDVAKNLHARSVRGETLLPHDHKFLSEYHTKQWTGDDPYAGMDKE